MNDKLENYEKRWTILHIILLFFASLAGAACNRTAPAEITVSAAANLIPAFNEIGAAFEVKSGIKVVYNFGGSGKLAQQIEQGAPVDLFASANVDYVTRLQTAGLISAQTEQVYARGRLVMWGRDEDLVPQTIADLADRPIERIAMANPQHAPYGVIARAALENGGLWEELQPKLVLADDVRQTLTYAETGDVTVALVPLSLVFQLDQGGYSLIPADLHPPIEQALGVVNSSRKQAEAQQFVDFVLSEAGQTVLEKYGYESIR